MHPLILQPICKVQQPKLECAIKFRGELFLSDPFHIIENRLLPNNVIFLRNIGEAHEKVEGSDEGKND
jgi:hypothetical protein